MMKKIKKAYVDTSPGAMESGISCLSCTEEVEWLAILRDGDRVGVCGCKWTMWMKDNISVYRCSTEKQ